MHEITLGNCSAAGRSGGFKVLKYGLATVDSEGRIKAFSNFLLALGAPHLSRASPTLPLAHISALQIISRCKGIDLKGTRYAPLFNYFAHV